MSDITIPDDIGSDAKELLNKAHLSQLNDLLQSKTEMDLHKSGIRIACIKYLEVAKVLFKETNDLEIASETAFRAAFPDSWRDSQKEES